MWRAAPPPCSRPHPLKEQEGEVGNTTALLCERKSSRGRVIDNHWGETRNPPERPKRPGSRFPPRPPFLPPQKCDGSRRTNGRGTGQATWFAPCQRPRKQRQA